jgi:hypothetical protein
MAGIIFLALFFVLGTVLVFLVHYALARENEHWAQDPQVAPPLEAPSAPAERHDRAA